jgi:pimeloyl-ACP methyl ester carboxylesterase
MGHSFGGITALMTASKLEDKCKACIVLDPWLYAFEEEMNKNEIRIKCPI